MYKNFSVILLLGLLALVWACEETPSVVLTQADREDQIILDYLADQNITDFQKTSSGMYYRYITQNSDGENIQDSLILSLGYTGKLFYGDIFDSSILRDDSIEVQVGTGRIYDGMIETTFPALDTIGGRTEDTVMCANFPGQVISGWTETLDIIKLDEKMEIYLPSRLAYGTNSSGIIPASTPIMFEIETYAIADSLTDMDDRCN